MTKEEYDEKFSKFKEDTQRIQKENVRKLEIQYKREIREFALHYVALWNACQSLGLNDRQTKGMIEFLINNENKEVGK